MFTRMIDPFNNQTWKVPKKPKAEFLYKTRAENVEQKKMKKTSARNNKSFYKADVKASETWTVGEETRNQPTTVGKAQDSDDEIDDFVIV